MALTFPATTIALLPSVSSSHEPRLKVLTASFGGGYEQRQGDGPTGAVMRDWNVRWENISKTIAKTFDDFLVARAGVEVFKWTQPMPYDVEGEKYYICGSGDWKWTYGQGDTNTFTAVFRQRPAA